MKFRKNPVKLFAFLFLVSLAFDHAAPDDTKDKQECTNSLVGLATCLPYVGGNTMAPTPDCCSGLKQVLKTDKKCLCLVIKDRNDPEIGININVTLALGLPTVCQAPANISQCPDLLHLDPKSPDAQLFYRYGHESSSIASSPSATVASNPISSPSAAGAPGPSAHNKNDGCKNGKSWLGIEAIITILLLWSFT